MSSDHSKRRLAVLGRHLTANDRSAVAGSMDEVLAKARGKWHGVDPLSVDINVLNEPLPPVVRGKILHFIDQIKDTRPDSNLSSMLPGPQTDIGEGKRYPNVKSLLLELQRSANAGSNHMLWSTYQDRYANGVRTANIVMPVVSFTRNNVRAPIIAEQIIISHPKDAMRIARTHIQKMPDQSLFLSTGVLTQLDNDRWKEQRAHLTEAFMPYQSLQHVLPVSEARAKLSLKLLHEQIAAHSDGIVQLNEFLLNETMAQLMLAMFGLPEDIAEQQNKRVREAFSYLLEATGGTGAGSAEEIDPEELQVYSMRLFEFIGEFLNIAGESKGVSEAVDSGEPTSVKGPLSARIFDISDDFQEKVFNAATFVFAGHDTTANTMSWLIFEACQQPDIQRKLQQESDAFFASTTGAKGDIAYDDLQRLPFMTRCLAETLRLWPVVPNGTFRQLQFDDTVTGPHGEDVPVKAGTFVQIANWMRHRSPELWGDDVLEFNPMREFRGNELSPGMVGFNPQSERYSPFTFTPRDCMGKNFAQMEMRVILVYLFHHFEFQLAGSTAKFDRANFLGVNRATLGPRDIGVDPSKPAELGLYVKIVARR
jgi:cytochrome P450